VYNSTLLSLTTGQSAALAVDSKSRAIVTHMDPAQQVFKQIEATTAQTGTAIWTPTSTKKIALTSLLLTFGGNTAGVVTVWFGASGDTTFTQGTDQVVFRGEFAPSGTSKPIFAQNYGVSPLFCANADFVLRLTTTTAMTIYVTAYGYEF